MSVQAISWALNIKAGSPNAKCVLLCIANYADENGHCWPTQATIARQTEQSIDSVQRRMRELEAIGLITKTERPESNGRAGGRYFYQLSLETQSSIQDIETTPQPAARSKTTPQKPQTTPQTPPKPHRTVAVQTVILNPSLEPSDARTKVEKTKGHRLPNDWSPSPKQISDATALGLTESDIGRAAVEFRDYWTDRAGRDACKISWDGTWRNRCRAIAERLGRKPKVTNGSTYRFTRADWERAVRVFKETSNWPGPGPEPGSPGCLVPADLCGGTLL